MSLTFSRSLIENVASTVISRHALECVFEEDAITKITDEFFRVIEKDPVLCIDVFYDLMVRCIQKYEVYCPHEGIDRRASCLSLSPPPS